MKKYVLMAGVLAIATSCVSVRFPNELNVNVKFPNHMSVGEIDHMISRIPHTIKRPGGEMRVHVFKDMDTVNLKGKEFLFMPDSKDGKNEMKIKIDSTGNKNVWVIKKEKKQ